jgi:hypothetical protein
VCPPRVDATASQPANREKSKVLQIDLATKFFRVVRVVRGRAAHCKCSASQPATREEEIVLCHPHPTWRLLRPQNPSRIITNRPRKNKFFFSCGSWFLIISSAIRSSNAYQSTSHGVFTCAVYNLSRCERSTCAPQG